MCIFAVMSFQLFFQGVIPLSELKSLSTIKNNTGTNHHRNFSEIAQRVFVYFCSKMNILCTCAFFIGISDLINRTLA